MADTAILAPNGRWQGRDQTGQPCQNGKLYTYLNRTTTPKATYQDYQMLQPNTNPIILDGKGEANVYWAQDDLYTYKLFTSDDQEVTTQDDYPFVGSDSTNTTSQIDTNIARNNQFFYWYYGTSFSPVPGAGSASDQDYVCDDWYYSRVDTSYTVNITRQSFAVDQDEVPSNPTYFFRYQATLPATETRSQLYQTYKSVFTLAGQRVSLGLYARSSTSSTINVYLVQNFGTGGSPSSDVETLVDQFDLTASWAQYSATIDIPTIAGKTIGTNGDDNLVLRIKFPNDAAATVDLVNVQFQDAATLTPLFPFQTKETQFQELVNRVQDAVPSTGDVKATFKTTADPGWLLCNDTTIGNYTSSATTVGFHTKALYTLLWNNVTADYCPMFTSAGVLTPRGGSAEADFNGLRQLSLTRMLGRLIATAGQGSLSEPFTADAATDLCTLSTVNNLAYNANPVTLTTTGTLPAPLATATTYYAAKQSGTTVKLATTAANAINGTYIDITDAGTGTHTMTFTYGAWILGQTAGEENHGLIISEIPSHTHTFSSKQNNGASFTVRAGDNTSIGTGSVDSTGGSGLHNIIQPTIFMTHMIKL